MVRTRYAVKRFMGSKLFIFNRYPFEKGLVFIGSGGGGSLQRTCSSVTALPWPNEKRRYVLLAACRKP